MEIESLISEIQSHAGAGQDATATGPEVDRRPAPPRGAPERGTTKVVVVSAGYDSGDIADFFLDDELVPIFGPEGRRGLNVVVIDPGTTRIVSCRSYDLWGDPGAQGEALASDLESLPQGHIVLAALKDSGMEKLSEGALDALGTVGAKIDGSLDFRESYALIGVKGGRALAERMSSKMLLVDAALPFSVGSAQGRPTAGPLGGNDERTWEEALHILEEVGRARPR